MRISVKNVGALRKADLEIKGLTVIAGENNTGKSTVGKTLFVLFNTLKHLDEKITNTKEKLIQQYVLQTFSKDPKFDYLDSFILNEDIRSIFFASKTKDVGFVAEAVRKLVKVAKINLSDTELAQLVKKYQMY